MCQKVVNDEPNRSALRNLFRDIDAHYDQWLKLTQQQSEQSHSPQHSKRYQLRKLFTKIQLMFSIFVGLEMCADYSKVLTPDSVSAALAKLGGGVSSIDVSVEDAAKILEEYQIIFKAERINWLWPLIESISESDVETSVKINPDLLEIQLVHLLTTLEVHMIQRESLESPNELFIAIDCPLLDLSDVMQHASGFKIESEESDGGEEEEEEEEEEEGDYDDDPIKVPEEIVMLTLSIFDPEIDITAIEENLLSCHENSSGDIDKEAYLCSQNVMMKFTKEKFHEWFSRQQMFIENRLKDSQSRDKWKTVFDYLD
jgi:hypothetical protein